MATQPSPYSVKVANPDLSMNPRTYLTQDSSSGGTELNVASISGFPTTADFFVLIGDYGDEKAEIKLIDVSGTSGKTFTIATMDSSHEASDPVTLIEYDKIKIYGLLSEDATVYNVIETKDLDVTAQFTEYVYTGSTYSYFSTAYYNSNLDEISGYSEIVGSTSFTRKSVNRIIKSAARKALTTIDENANSRLTWDIALETLQDGLDEIGARKKRWEFWNTLKADTTTTSGTAYINKPTDLTQLVSIKVDGYKMQWISNTDYSRRTEGVTSSGRPSNYTEINSKYYLCPTPNDSYDVVYNYYKVPDVITNMTTEIDIPLVPVLIYYCGAQFAYIRGNERKGDSLYQQYVRLLEEQVEEYSGPFQDADAEGIERTSNLNDNYIINF